MPIALAMVSTLSGIAVIAALWSHNPFLAIICAPMVASVATAVVAIFGAFCRRTRHGLPVASTTARRAL
jgi:hypothetical protein